MLTHTVSQFVTQSMSSSTAQSYEIPSQTLISPSLNPSIQKNIDDWINTKGRDFHGICKKLHARHHTYNRFLQHQQQHTLPPDLNIKFEGFNQYPLTIEASQRELLKQKEVETFRSAMNTILSLRTDAYKQDIANLESQITLAMNNGNILTVVSQELPFVISNNTLRDHICFQLSALYIATHQQYMESQKQSDSTFTQSTAMDDSDFPNNNAKSDEHMANLIRNVLKEELKHMLKPSAPSPKKYNNHSHFKESHPNKTPKNEFERGRGNTPRRNGNGNHVRRSKSDSSRQSKSNSSNNKNRVNFSHQTPSNSDASPRGRRNYAATTNQFDDQRRQRNNFKSKSPPQFRDNNYNSNNNYNRQRNSSPPLRHRRN